MAPHVLHVAGDFPNQRVYVELVRHVEQAGVAQEVYAAVRSRAEADWKVPEGLTARVHLPLLLARRHRVLFRAKIRMITRHLARDVALDRVGAVHAHSIYSDGAVAWRLHRRGGLPYLVTVRNGDLNAFMRYRPDLAGVRNAVLRSAHAVVFLSPAYRERLLRRLPTAVRKHVERRQETVPNGVAPHWLAWTPPVRPPRDPAAPLRLLYAGDFSANKNVVGLIEAVSRVRPGRPVQLTLVGDGGGDEHQVVRTARQHPDWIVTPGRISDPVRLRDCYRTHDAFVMPSLTESFGVAYIEALSQGLPVLHTRGEGIDGLFEPGTVAEAVDPTRVDDIAAGILRLAERCDRVRDRCVAEAARFDWTRIAARYVALYGEMMP